MMEDMILRLDSRQRISLSKLLPFKNISFVAASTDENGDIILKPMTVIPAHEKWLYDNPEALKKLKRGLSQKGTIDRGSFIQYIDDQSPCMTFTISFTPEADADMSLLENDRSKKAALKAVRKALGYLQKNPRHPSLQTHPYYTQSGPNGEKVFEAYAQ